MKIFKIILLVLLVAFVGIQFVPTTLNESNNVLESDFMIVYDAPKQIETKLECHVMIAIVTTQNILGTIKYNQRLGF